MTSQCKRSGLSSFRQCQDIWRQWATSVLSVPVQSVNHQRDSRDSVFTRPQSSNWHATSEFAFLYCPLLYSSPKEMQVTLLGRMRYVTRYMNSTRGRSRLKKSFVKAIIWIAVTVWVFYIYIYHVKDAGHSAKSAGGRLQLNTHTPYVCGFAWSDMVHGCMVNTERAEMAAVSCGTSHASAVSTPLRWIFKNAL